MKTLLEDRRLLLPLLLTAVAIAVGSVLIIFLTGDASSGGSSSSQGASAPASAKGSGKAVTVDIKEFKYLPESITVKAGGRVKFVNADQAPHTATVAGGFDTGSLGKGDSKAVKFSKPGTFAYVCTFHAFMKGEVVVR